MKLRRCHTLFVELDEAPRFALDSLLSGGDGLDRRPRWLAHAPHLPAPVPVTLAQLALLERLPRDAWTEAAAVPDEAGLLPALRAAGLVVCDDDDPAGEAPRRDQALREVAWWPPAALAQAGGAWSGVDIAERGARGLTLDSEQLVQSFGEAPSPAHRRRPGSAVQALPPPSRGALDDLLATRRTCRNFDADAELPLASLATMLRRVWGALGTRELAPGAVAVKKSSPAGGGLHAVEAYLLVQRVQGLAPGLYHYLALEHALEPLQALAPEAAAALAHRAVAGQDWFANAPVLVVMTVRFERLFWKYRRHAKAWRVAHLDAGHLSQTMYLSATELGLGAFVTAAINDREVDAALDLAPLREAAIAVVGFGARAAGRRTMELDELTPVGPDPV